MTTPKAPKTSSPYGYPAVSPYGTPIPSGVSYGADAAAQAQMRLAQLETAMRRITEAPLGIAVVASVDDQRMVLSLGAGGLVQVARHPNAAVGDQVLVSRETMAVVEIMKDCRPTGIVATALDVAPGLVQVEIAQARRAVRTTRTAVVGERLIVDPSLVYVVGTLGVPTPAHAAAETGVTWDDVGGNEEAKEQLREAVELPYQHPVLYRAYGKRPPKGVMLSGPPGCIAADMHVPFLVVQPVGDGAGEDAGVLLDQGGSIESLCERFVEESAAGRRCYVASMADDGDRRICARAIEAVFSSGDRPCVRVRTMQTGRELVCTPDHPVATLEGFVPAGDLERGRKIFVRSEDRGQGMRRMRSGTALFVSDGVVGEHHLDFGESPEVDCVLSVQAVGLRPTYDVRMVGDPHNFVAGDGFVVHNCGKTLLARATATSVAKAHGRASVAAGGFQHVKGPELLNKWLGESEAAIRTMFTEARAFQAAHGYPAVVFLDEADALLGDRNRGTNVSINATTVPQFLAEMDGFEASSAIFLLATNRPDLLDAAVTREGRVDRKVRVGRPSPDDAAQILAIHLRARPLADGLDRADVARQIARQIFEPGRWVVRDYGAGAQLELRHMVNGALLAEIVEQATTAALFRDVAGGRQSAGGICSADLLGAVESLRRGQRDVDHSLVLRELAEAEREVGRPSPDPVLSSSSASSTELVTSSLDAKGPP